MDGKKGLNMKFLLLLFGILPLAVAAIVLTVVSILMSSSNLKDQTKQSLVTAATGLKAYYEKEYVTDGEPTYGHDYVDMLSKEEGIELTLFVGDTRFATSLYKEDGVTRNEGTQSGPGIWESVSAGQSYYSDDVVIGGKDFYVYYLPVRDASGSVVGMAFAGKPCTEVNASKTKLVLISSGIAVGLVVVAAIIILIVSQSIVSALKKTTDALEVISNGDLTALNDADSSLSETRKLIDSSKKLQRNIDNMLREIKDCSESIICF